MTKDEDCGFSGELSVEMITMAQKNTTEPTRKSGGSKPSRWRTFLAVLPGVGASLLPVGGCPACLSAYAGLVSSLSLGFLLETAYLLPLTALFLLIAVAALAYKANARRGYGPFVLGLLASVVLLVGKFVFGSEVAVYGGMAALIFASVWNAWPRRDSDTGKGSCSVCASRGTDAAIDTWGGSHER